MRKLEGQRGAAWKALLRTLVDRKICKGDEFDEVRPEGKTDAALDLQTALRVVASLDQVPAESIYLFRSILREALRVVGK